MSSAAFDHNPPAINGLGGHLIIEGILTPDQARDAANDARATGTPLIRHLIDVLNVDSRILAQLASAEFGVPIFDLNALNREVLPELQIDTELMTKHHAVPLFRRGNRLFLAVSDPTNLNALDEFKFAAGINTDAVLVDDKALTKLIADLGDKANDFESEARCGRRMQSGGRSGGARRGG